jgi:hypothetical protein
MFWEAFCKEFKCSSVAWRFASPCAAFSDSTCNACPSRVSHACKWFWADFAPTVANSFKKVESTTILGIGAAPLPKQKMESNRIGIITEKKVANSITQRIACKQKLALRTAKHLVWQIQEASHSGILA